jgi:large subunit ribosomal protein L24e
VFQDEGGPSEEQRREIMLAKAKKYEALSRGDLSGLTQKEIDESAIDVSCHVPLPIV